MRGNSLLPQVIFLSSLIPLYNYQKPSPFVEAQQKSLQALGVRVHPYYVQGRPFIKYFQALVPLHRLVAETSAEVIHAHYSLNGIAATLGQTGRPIVLSLLGDELLPSDVTVRGKHSRALLTYWLTQVVASQVSQVIVKSDEMRRKLWRKHDVHVVPNGVSRDMFYPSDRSEARRALGLAICKQYILFPSSRYRPVKDYALAEEAFRLVVAQGCEAEMLTLEAVPHEKVPLYINAANAVLFTSVSEGAPNVIKEAMACNAPIVTVDVGDVRQVVEGTRQCWVTSRDPHQIARRLCEVLKRDEPSNGRERIQPYDQAAVARRLVEIYYLAIEKHSGN